MIKNNDGLTLLEVLLSITILGAFLITFSAMIGNGLKANEINQERLDALLIAQECIENTKSDSSANFNDSNNKCSGSILYNRHSFLINRVIHPLNATTPQLFTITVIVSGQTGSEIELQTKIFKLN